MTVKSKFLPILMALAMTASFFGCSSKDDTEPTEPESSDSAAEQSGESTDVTEDETETEDATVQANIPLEYDGTDVNDDCADTINKYFTAIINQTYDSYKETIDPYYFEVYKSWLDGNYGYGMETSFETMHQNLMDSAVSANDGKDVKDIYITKLKLTSNSAKDGEDGSDAVEEFLSQYDTIIGEGFSEELRKQCDDVISVTFTMTANCDGTELEILQDMELLMSVHGDEYKILG
jgi:hypothetical protein